MKAFHAGMGLLLIALAACKSGSGETGGGGTGGSGGAGSGDTSCDGVCNSLMTQHCFYTNGDDDCRMSCTGWETQYVASGSDDCQQAWADYKSCIVSAALTCPSDSDAHWAAIACREHWDHFQGYCIQKNATPDTPCTDNAVFDTFCQGDTAHPHGKSCLGNRPAECVVGGTENNANLYCCP
ncbi:Hypothetical protein A7982_10286 [Minicystis rosea]|nr:Hypothetical protein A7982_10286 [Minicystis rosea]